MDNLLHAYHSISQNLRLFENQSMDHHVQEHHCQHLIENVLVAVAAL